MTGRRSRSCSTGWATTTPAGQGRPGGPAGHHPPRLRRRPLALDPLVARAQGAPPHRVAHRRAHREERRAAPGGRPGAGGAERPLLRLPLRPRPPRARGGPPPLVRLVAEHGQGHHRRARGRPAESARAGPPHAGGPYLVDSRPHVRDTDQGLPHGQAALPGAGRARRSHRRRGAEGRAHGAARGRRRLRRRAGLLPAGEGEGGRRHRQGQAPRPRRRSAGSPPRTTSSSSATTSWSS